ncbi:thiopeptide-type bacteriocin biosynthesis domain protein [Staphylococcus xylosus]|uniref:lantibiotic dehydratase n=1 Tax=Staphylococcus xylosus TaxID=1288 RepID=UPI00085BDB9F|nr:lantibiotic dehydratase [Staphylococcus xylosus]SCU36927.1 thiopeptide-type bacteriocin biosynthesis domain protein [Staphylococcus xylosus]
MELFEHYLYRSPLLSIKNFKEIEIDDISDKDYVFHLINFIKKHNLYANIYSSSKSLYYSIIHFNKDTSDKKTKNILISLYKYLVRMTFRSTPFGMYSGVGINTIHNKEHTKEEIIYHGYINNSALYIIINHLNSEDKILEKIKIYNNPNIYEDSNHIFLPYQVKYNLNEYEDSGNISLKKTELIRRVIELCAYETNFIQLKKTLCSEFKVPEIKVHEYLKKLIAEDFLITEFKTNLSTKNSYKSIIKSLEKIDETNNMIYKLLKELDSIIYKISITSNRSIILNLLIYADKLIASKFPNFKENVINIDTKIIGRKFQITNNDIKNIKDVAILASQLNLFEPSKVLEEYKNKFSEIYGQDEDVKLTELLNGSLGLGLPNEYNTSINLHNIKKTNSILGILENWKTEALLKNNKVIKLTDDKLLELKPYLQKNNINTSFDMYLTKLNNSSKLYLKVNSGSLHATQTYGRFLYMFPSNIAEDTYNFNSYKPKDLCPMEIVYNHPFPKIQNVMTSQLPNKVIDFSSHYSDIKVNDLYVFLGEDFNFYIRDINGNLIYPNFNNLHNTTLAPSIIRFLSDISMQYITGTYFLNFSTIEHAYSPRIEYKNIILSPQKWNIKLDKGLNFDDFILKIEHFSKIYELDEKFYLVYEDQRLYINLNSRISYYTLYTEYKKREILELEELEEELDFSQNLTLNELVFSASSIKPAPLKDAVNFPKEKIRDKKEVILPGNDWICLNLYYNEYNFKELMAFGIWDTIFTEFLEKTEIETFFFIRYYDSSNHLRVRFRVLNNDFVIKQKILAIINSFKDKGFIKSFTIVPYYRETYRYGGASCIQAAEKCFQVESKITSKYYADLYDDFDILDFAIDNILEILNYFRDSINSKIDLLEFIEKNKAVKDLYRKKRNRIFQSINNNKYYMKTYRMQCWRDSEYQNYITLLKENNKLKDNALVLSIIHMFCNRLLGTDREMEHKILELIYRSLLDYKKINSIS